MIDIKNSQFQVENVSLGNGLRDMNGDVAYQIMSTDTIKAFENGEKDVLEKIYHFVLIEGVEKEEIVPKKEAPKQDIMRKNKKVID